MLYFSVLQRFNSRVDFTARIGNRGNVLCIIFRLSFIGRNLFLHFCQRAVRRIQFAQRRCILFNRRLIRRNGAAFFRQRGNRFSIRLYSPAVFRNRPGFSRQSGNSRVDFTALLGNVGNGLCIIFRLSFISRNLFLHFCQRAVRRIQVIQCRCIPGNRFFVALYFSILQRVNSRVDFTALLGNCVNGLCITLDRSGIRLYSLTVFRNRPGFSGQRGNRRINFAAFLGNVGNGLFIVLYIRNILRNLSPNIRLTLLQMLHSPVIHSADILHNLIHCLIYFTARIGNVGNGLCIIVRLSFIGRNLLLHFCQRAVRRIQFAQRRCILFNRRLIRRNGAAFFRQRGNRFSIRLYSLAVFRNCPGFSGQRGNRFGVALYCSVLQRRNSCVDGTALLGNGGNGRVDFTALLGNRVNGLCIIIDIARIAGDPSRQGI